MRHRDKEKERIASKKYYETHKLEKKEYVQTHRTQIKEWFRTHKLELNEKTRASRLRTKIKVLTHYGNGKLACIRCGSEGIAHLSLDHINGGGHAERLKRGSNGIYLNLIRNNYPEGYQTLCMNCRWDKRAENGEVGRRA